MMFYLLLHVIQQIGANSKTFLFKLKAHYVSEFEVNQMTLGKHQKGLERFNIYMLCKNINYFILEEYNLLSIILSFIYYLIPFTIYYLIPFTIVNLLKVEEGEECRQCGFPLCVDHRVVFISFLYLFKGSVYIFYIF